MTTSDRTALTWRDGIVVGLIAYAAVAIFYSLFDLLAARGTLHTVDLLGKSAFRGLRDPSVLLTPIKLDTAAIFLYNAVHFVISLAIGLFAVRVVAQAERKPNQRFVVMFVLAAGFVATVFAVGALTGSFRSVLPWWSIIVANGLAMVIAGAYLLRRSPNLGIALPRAAA